MNLDEQLRVLKHLRERIAEFYKSVDKKRSWRPSEKAMAKGNYAAELTALDAAITRLLNERTQIRNEMDEGAQQ